MNHFRVIFLLSISVLISPGAFSQKKEEKLVRKTFDQYKKAILNQDGEEALKYLDGNTLQYYSDVLGYVRNADSLQLSKLSILDKVMVLIIRHNTPRETLLSFDGRSLLKYAVDQGMIGDNVNSAEIGEIIIEENFAKGEVLSNGKGSSIYFHFYKENDQWKIDLTSIFDLTNMAFGGIIAQSGLEENVYLMQLLELMTGRAPDETIWKPVQ
jgi:hypothetical protein